MERVYKLRVHYLSALVCVLRDELCWMLGWEQRRGETGTASPPCSLLSRTHTTFPATRCYSAPLAWSFCTNAHPSEYEYSHHLKMTTRILIHTKYWDRDMEKKLTQDKIVSHTQGTGHPGFSLSSSPPGWAYEEKLCTKKNRVISIRSQKVCTAHCDWNRYYRTF